MVRAGRAPASGGWAAPDLIVPSLSPPPSRSPSPAGLRFATILLALLALVPTPSQALLASWSCWHDGETSILCVSTMPADATEPAAQAPSARSRPSRPMPPRYPWKFVRIPILTVPTDLEGVRQLASAVMCAAHPECAVAFSNGPDALAIAALDDLYDAR